MSRDLLAIFIFVLVMTIFLFRILPISIIQLFVSIPKDLQSLKHQRISNNGSDRKEGIFLPLLTMHLNINFCLDFLFSASCYFGSCFHIFFLYLPRLYYTTGVYMLMNYVIANGSKKLKETRVPCITLLEIGLILFQMTIFMANAISKPTHWK